MTALPSECSCIKGPNSYGTEGWHIHVFTEESAFLYIRKIELAEFRKRSGRGPRAGEETTRMNQHCADLSARYVGTKIAYERCPAYEYRRVTGKVEEAA